MSMLREVRIGVRTLFKSPGFVVTAVLSLGIAIGAAAAAFSVIDAVRFRALPFPDADRLVVITERPADPAHPALRVEACPATCDVGYETYANLLRTYPFKTVDQVIGFTGGGKALNTGEEPIVVYGGVASDNLFSVLGVQPILGRVFTADDNRLGVPLVTVLSHDLWTQHFGQSRAIIGQTIKLSDSHYTVIGVMPRGFDFESKAQFWMPVVPTLDPSTKPSIRTLNVVAHLAPGRSVEQLNAELAGIDPAALATATGQGVITQMQLAAAPLRARYAEATQAHDLIFGAIVAAVLLIACTNLANLVLVRSLHQQREFAVRSALGAGAGRLVRELLVQHAVVVVLAAAIGMAFGSWFLHVLQSVEVLQSLRPSGMDYRLDGRVLGFVALVAAVALAVLSVVPVKLIARADLQHFLREGAPTAGGGRLGRRAQQAFVVTQIAAAVVLLVGAGLMVRTVIRLARFDLGFDAAKLVQGTPSYPHPWRVKEKYLPVTRELQRTLAAMPGVSAAVFRAEVPLARRGAAPQLVLAGQANPLGANLTPRTGESVSPGYFTTLGIPVVKGREFTEQDLEAGLPVAVVNQWSATHWWPNADPVGQTIRVDTLPGQGVTLTVVGVVGNNKAAQANLLLSAEAPELYRPYEQASSPFPSFYLKANGSALLLARPMRLELARSVPDRPVFAQPVAQQATDQLSAVRMNAFEVAGFALVGLGLALVGIHGVLSYAVGKRTQEIGLRGALGASTAQISRAVLGDALWLVAAGLVVGLPLAAMATKVIEKMLYGTNPIDPLVYIGVALGVAAVALLASYLPARRAARVDPLVALRST